MNKTVKKINNKNRNSIKINYGLQHRKTIRKKV